MIFWFLGFFYCVNFVLVGMFLFKMGIDGEGVRVGYFRFRDLYLSFRFLWDFRRGGRFRSYFGIGIFGLVRFFCF